MGKHHSRPHDIPFGVPHHVFTQGGTITPFQLTLEDAGDKKVYICNGLGQYLYRPNAILGIDAPLPKFRSRNGKKLNRFKWRIRKSGKRTETNASVCIRMPGLNKTPFWRHPRLNINTRGQVRWSFVYENGPDIFGDLFFEQDRRTAERQAKEKERNQGHGGLHLRIFKLLGQSFKEEAEDLGDSLIDRYQRIGRF